MCGFCKRLKNFICAASKRCSSLFLSTQASLPNFNAALAVLVICVLVFTVFCIVCTVFFVLFLLYICIPICFVSI